MNYCCKVECSKSEERKSVLSHSQIVCVIHSRESELSLHRDTGKGFHLLSSDLKSQNMLCLLRQTTAYF